jgi:hypothetical protein
LGDRGRRHLGRDLVRAVGGLTEEPSSVEALGDMAEDVPTPGRLEIDELREDIEKLVLLEEVAERRQQRIEERIDRAIEAGLSPEQIRAELNLSKDSLHRMLEQDPPELAERLGISEETAENLSQTE